MISENRAFIQSLAKGLTVLQAFSAENPKLTLTQLSEKTGMKIAALQRYTTTLMELGFLKRNKHREFFLGPKVLSLGFAYLNSAQLTRQIQDYLDEFSEKVDKTVNLAVLDEDNIFFLYRKEAQRFLTFDLRAGSRLPAYCTGSGKLLLAAQDDKGLKTRLARMDLRPITQHSITDRKKLWDDLMKTRQRGFSISDRELYLDLYSIGMPLVDQDRKVVASVNLSLTMQDAKGPLLKEMLQMFMELGRTLSAALGYEGDYPILPANPNSGEGF